MGDNLKRNTLEADKPPLAAFIDNDNIVKGIEDQYQSSSVQGYDIEKIVEYLKDEGELRIGRVYFNPSDFENVKKKSLLHRFNINLIEPRFTDTYKHKSLADPNMVWDIAEVFHNHPEIEKFAIISGDKDFLPIMRKLHAAGKDGILIYVDGSEAKDLQETAENIGWKKYEVPVYRRGSSSR